MRTGLAMKPLTLRACGVVLGAVVVVGCGHWGDFDLPSEPFYTEDAVIELPGIAGTWINEEGVTWTFHSQSLTTSNLKESIASIFFRAGDAVFLDLLMGFHVLFKVELEKDTLRLVPADITGFAQAKEQGLLPDKPTPGDWVTFLQEHGESEEVFYPEEEDWVFHRQPMEEVEEEARE